MSSPQPHTTTPSATEAALETALHDFADLPPEAILKQDLLRLGLEFTQEALRPAVYKTKDYFIFSFDMVPGRRANRRAAHAHT